MSCYSEILIFSVRMFWWSMLLSHLWVWKLYRAFCFNDCLVCINKAIFLFWVNFQGNPCDIQDSCFIDFMVLGWGRSNDLKLVKKLNLSNIFWAFWKFKHVSNINNDVPNKNLVEIYGHHWSNPTKQQLFLQNLIAL